MNTLRISFCRVLAIFWLRPFLTSLAAYDFAAELASSQALKEAPEPERARQLQACRGRLPIVYRQLRRTLGGSLAFIVLWVLGALAVDIALRWTGLKLSLRAAGTLGIASLVVLAWTTLGRLQWRSWKGQTSPERADESIYWLLYGLGTFLGVLAIRASG